MANIQLRELSFNVVTRVLFSFESNIFDDVTTYLTSLGYDKPITTGKGQTKSLLFVGKMPVCLCAHTDTVYKNKFGGSEALDNICIKLIKSSGNKFVRKLYANVDKKHKVGIGADDRVGILMILTTLRSLKAANYDLPSVLICSGEERGCKGSHAFVEKHKKFPTDINCFVQLDRRGSDDVVRYSDDNIALTKAFEAVGFKSAFGTCTDISVLMPAYNVSGVNLSCGYYNEHSAEKEYFILEEMNYSISRLLDFLTSDAVNTKYVYQRKSYFSSPKGYLTSHDYYSDYYGIDDCDCDDYSFNGKCNICGRSLDNFNINTVVEGYLPSEKRFCCNDCCDDLISDGYSFCPVCQQSVLLYPGCDVCPVCGTETDALGIFADKEDK